MRAILASMAALTVVVGCAPVPVLVPSPAAVRAPGSDLAFVEVAGVRLWAGGGWSGDPGNLPDLVTPVVVTLENRSGHPVRMSYQDFVLKGGTGFTYAALPPFALQGIGSRETEQPDVVLVDTHAAAPVVQVRPPHVYTRFHYDHFRVARPYARFYIGMPLWPRLWAWNLAYHERWYPAWPSSLPSGEMLQRALPEGVLEDGGSISGYLYFQYAGREANAELQLNVQDASTNERLGVANVPFIVRR